MPRPRQQRVISAHKRPAAHPPDRAFFGVEEVPHERVVTGALAVDAAGVEGTGDARTGARRVGFVERDGVKLGGEVPTSSSRNGTNSDQAARHSAMIPG